jgi:hypothetical protein
MDMSKVDYMEIGYGFNKDSSTGYALLVAKEPHSGNWRYLAKGPEVTSDSDEAWSEALKGLLGTMAERVHVSVLRREVTDA